MKKIIVLALSLIIAMGCVASFAEWKEVANFDKCPVEGSMNDAGVDYTVANTIRQRWTNSRGLPDAIENAIFVERDDEGICVAIYSDEYMVSDKSVGKIGVVYADLKAVKTEAFCGLMMDVDPDKEGLGSGNETVDYYDNGACLKNGYGFSLAGGSTLRAFISAEKYVYADFDLGFDAGEDFHTYEVYKNADEKKAFVAADKKIVAFFDFSGETASICNPDGSVAIAGADGKMQGGDVAFATIGEELEIYLDNVGFEGCTAEDIPTELMSAKSQYNSDNPAPATEAPAATEEPKATEAPAETTAPATEAPAETTVPATDAPAETEGTAPTDDAKADEHTAIAKKGCGSSIGCGALAVIVFAAVCFRKKEN